VRLAREAELSRSRAEKLIRDGRVLVGGKAQTKPGFGVDACVPIQVDMPLPTPLKASPEPIPIDLLYEDAFIAVVVKPCGMVVHPAAGNESGTLVNALLYHLRGLSGIGGALRPGIVHRLDKDTSGLMIIAKTDESHLKLSKAFQDRTIEKEYVATVEGRVSQPGTINAPIGRHSKDRKKMAIQKNGREAITHYQIIENLRKATFLRVQLITGRTHQIRVHFASIGHSILGDVIYGSKSAQNAAPRLMLHARQIAFSHPISGEAMRFEADIPEEFFLFEKE
jgi:23S rRNA pseudouridine1911/1915/1917 synthase